MRHGRIGLSRSDRLFLAVINALLFLLVVVIAYPLIYILSSSFSSTRAVTSAQVWLWPVEPSLDGYSAVFRNQGILSGYANSAFYTVFGTLINVAVTIMAAFPLSRRDFYGRGFFMFLLTFTMLFSGGLIPYYLVVRALGMVNTRWALLIPSAMAVYQVIIARTFFQATIPGELSDAAEIDGCSDLGFLVRIVLPLSTAIIAVLTLMYAVGNWNSYFSALIFLSDAAKYPLQIALRNILILNEFDPGSIASRGIDVRKMREMQGLSDLLKYALIVVASLPVLLLYPFVQRYFVRGVLIGSLKG
jgi:ABC-type glycerol-3-phosphate transport system permease component